MERLETVLEIFSAYNCEKDKLDDAMSDIEIAKMTAKEALGCDEDGIYNGKIELVTLRTCEEFEASKVSENVYCNEIYTSADKLHYDMRFYVCGVRKMYIVCLYNEGCDVLEEFDKNVIDSFDCVYRELEMCDMFSLKASKISDRLHELCLELESKLDINVREPKLSYTYKMELVTGVKEKPEEYSYTDRDGAGTTYTHGWKYKDNEYIEYTVEGIKVLDGKGE